MLSDTHFAYTQCPLNGGSSKADGDDGGDPLDFILDDVAVEDQQGESAAGGVSCAAHMGVAAAAMEGGSGVAGRSGAAKNAKKSVNEGGRGKGKAAEKKVPLARKAQGAAGGPRGSVRKAGTGTLNKPAVAQGVRKAAGRGRKRKVVSESEETEEESELEVLPATGASAAEEAEECVSVVQEGGGTGMAHEQDQLACGGKAEEGGSERPRRQGLRARAPGKRAVVEEENEGSEGESCSEFSDASEDEDYVAQPRGASGARAASTPQTAADPPAQSPALAAAGAADLDAQAAGAGRNAARQQGGAANTKGAKEPARKPGKRQGRPAAAAGASQEPPAKRAAGATRGARMSAAAAAAAAAPKKASSAVAGAGGAGSVGSGGCEKRPSTKQLAYLVALKCPEKPATMAECSALIDKYRALASAAREARDIAEAEAEAAAAAAGEEVEEEEEEEAPKEVTKQELRETLQNVFGHEDFRSGQEEALTRVLKGQSTLLISATGGGKSLCFQLPACHLGGAILVVSPLLSLIQDQLQHLPPGITGATLNSTQTMDERQGVVGALKQGKIHVLFVAPEQLMTDNFVVLAKSIPPFKLACIDEAHCVSEWAHNFRPSYLRLRHILQGALRIRTILALTATATRAMERDITAALGIAPSGVIRTGLLRPNLHLSVSTESERQMALLNLLQRDPRFKTGSVIVYCSLRTQCQTMATYLTTHSVQAEAQILKRSLYGACMYSLQEGTDF